MGVRVGVIGAGWWATSVHLPALLAHKDADVVGVADVAPTRAEVAATRFGVTHAFTDHRDLLALDLDAVVVATPNHAHFEPARDALDAGADVLVEKPMVVSVDEGRELVALAERQGRLLHVGYPFPYTRHCRKLAELVTLGELGEVLLATSLFATSVLPLYRGVIDDPMTVSEGTLWPTGEATYSDPLRGGGQLQTQVTHAASTLLFLTGMEPSDVCAQASTYDTTVDVWDSVSFKTTTGAIATIASTGTVADHAQRVEEYRLFGSLGQASLSTSAGTLSHVQYGGPLSTERPLDEGEIYPSDAPARRLVDAFLGREPVHVGGDLGLRTVELLSAAERAAHSGS